MFWRVGDGEVSIEANEEIIYNKHPDAKEYSVFRNGVLVKGLVAIIIRKEEKP